MAGTVRSEAYTNLLRAIVDLRKQNDMSQADVAKRLGKPPSFVGKYELGERRLDVVETLVILAALGIEPLEFLKANVTDLPEKL
ncbi:MAG: helix-turn-helix transcriptional regulator [Sulfitobacter sp.]